MLIIFLIIINTFNYSSVRNNLSKVLLTRKKKARDIAVVGFKNRDVFAYFVGLMNNSSTKVC